MSGALPGRAPPQPSKPKPGPRRTPRAEAEARLLAFAQRKGRGAFRALSRDQVARGAIDRVYDPNRIEQMASSLCGPAAMVEDVPVMLEQLGVPLQNVKLEKWSS